jgi:hypothetical protein
VWERSGVPKTVLLLGAGASVADVATKPAKSRPPLDLGFFRVASQRAPNDARIATVRSYFQRNYGLDICGTGYDSVEGVMSRLYPDMFNRLLEDEALMAFRDLLRVFTDRLARTTNAIGPTQRRLLYRMLSRLLASGTPPGDITIITFNQDLQAEKTLELLSTTARWSSLREQIFSFPGLYAMRPSVWAAVTGPTRGAAQEDVFAHRTERKDCIRLLKLHGSLNWYSTHTSATPSRLAMLNPARRLSVTRRRTIAPDMTLTRKRKVYTLPVVVPPVNHKSSVMPTPLGRVWTLAERRLIDAIA